MLIRVQFGPCRVVVRSGSTSQKVSFSTHTQLIIEGFTALLHQRRIPALQQSATPLLEDEAISLLSDLTTKKKIC